MRAANRYPGNSTIMFIKQSAFHPEVLFWKLTCYVYWLVLGQLKKSVFYIVCETSKLHSENMGIVYFLTCFSRARPRVNRIGYTFSTNNLVPPKMFLNKNWTSRVRVNIWQGYIYFLLSVSLFSPWPII